LEYNDVERSQAIRLERQTAGMKQFDSAKTSKQDKTGTNTIAILLLSTFSFIL
jgi:hypothetical protein